MKNYKMYLFVSYTYCLFAPSLSSQDISYYRNQVELGAMDFCEYEDADYIPYFRDDFDGNELDTETWLTWTPTWMSDSDNSFESRAVNDDATMFWRDENVKVENGLCKLFAKEEVSTWEGITREYTSGTIHGRLPLTKTKYGKYEIRCKHPEEIGFKSSFWTFSQGFPLPVSEIDFIEYGDLNGGLMTSNIHVCYDDKVKCNELGVHDNFPDMSEDFVTCGTEWMPHKIIWYFINSNGERVDLRTIYRYMDLDGNFIEDCSISAGVY